MAKLHCHQTSSMAKLHSHVLQQRRNPGRRPVCGERAESSKLKITLKKLEATAGEAIASPSTTRLERIGTGVMGRFMCSHIINAGYTLTIFNRIPAKAQPLHDLGTHLLPSPSALASQFDVFFTIVGYPSDVRSVLLDPTSGALAALRSGGVLDNMTTSEPSLAIEIASAKVCASIDDPISGGDRGAQNATLAIFADGDEAVIQRLKPLLELYLCLDDAGHLRRRGEDSSRTR